MVLTTPTPHDATAPQQGRQPHTVFLVGAVAAVALLVAAIVVVATRHNPVVQGLPGTTAQGLPCGGEHPVKDNGTPWKCTFDDEFDGNALSNDLWTPTTTAQTGFRGGQECIVAGALHVGGGLLSLTATRTAARQCGRYVTSYNSGMISTKNKFAQTYGRFEMRAEFPPGVGLQPAFWMVPQNPDASGHPTYGEIDIAEEWGNSPQYVDPHLHYVTTPGSPTGGAACRIATNASAFHTYTLAWTPTQMRFDYDDATCWTTQWLPQPPQYAPTGARAPTPFDQPFYIIVQLAVGGAKTPFNLPGPSTPFPANMEVDYVRVWS